MNTIPRRKFLKSSAGICAGGCLMMATSKLSAINSIFSNGEKPDPSVLNYCGYKCPEGCEFKKASVENDIELKKEAFKAWKIEERFGITFEADDVYCYGCKNPDKPEGVVLTNCSVRSCVIEKELDCCIECNELVECDKELWDRFPDFKKQVIEMQAKYLAN